MYTLNIRGLYKSRLDIQQALHCHEPDILVLTEMKHTDLRRRPWLNDLLINYYSRSSLSATGGTFVCGKNKLTILNLTSLREINTNGRSVAQNTPILLLSTHWWSCSSTEALKLRKEVQF